MNPSRKELRLPETADFGIDIDFVPNSPDPARVFRAMTNVIEACELVDTHLASALGATIKPVLLLEGVESASIVTWLRSAIQSVDDEALKSGDYKKIIGTYFVRGKVSLVKFLEARPTVSNAGEIYDLQRVIHEAALDTHIPLALEPPMPISNLAESVLALSEATTPLDAEDKAYFVSSEGTDTINTRFHVTAEQIEEILTQETITNNDTMILKVKKPDFLGDSMWDFRYEGKRLVAKVQDDLWLRRFHDGDIVLRPGDALRGMVEVQTKYGQDKEVIAIHHRVIKVDEVIPRGRAPQGSEATPAASTN